MGLRLRVELEYKGGTQSHLVPMGKLEEWWLGILNRKLWDSEDMLCQFHISTPFRIYSKCDEKPLESFEQGGCYDPLKVYEWSFWVFSGKQTKGRGQEWSREIWSLRQMSRQERMMLRRDRRIAGEMVRSGCMYPAGRADQTCYWTELQFHQCIQPPGFGTCARADSDK